MYEILTATEMHQAEKATIAQGTRGYDLMRAAGQAVADRIVRDYAPTPVLVLCGRGNNGGDGFIVAALLEKAGWPVRVACLAKPITGDAAEAAKSFVGKVEALNSNLAVKDAAIVIDAVFGTGFSGVLDPELVTFFDKVRAKAPAIIAIDVPSGIDATTATVAEGTLKADLTVTFARKKPAHLLAPARHWCGKIVRADIGIPDACVAETNAQAFVNNPALWLASFPLPGHDSHKYTRGFVHVYGGTHRTGAASLAARAAQRAGAGIVSIACAEESALFYRLAGDSLLVDTLAAPADFAALCADARHSASVIGPGTLPRQGGEEELRTLVASSLAAGKPAVLDGDVFRAFEHHPKQLFALLDPAKHVLTPHAGEFIRLFGHIEGNKLEQARAAARLANAVILYKGAETIIAAPEGLAVIDVGAPPTLATAGSGDVLSGIIAGFVAQGMPPFFAACAAVFLHGDAARIHGLGLIAEDIISHIPQSLNGLFGVKNSHP